MKEWLLDKLENWFGRHCPAGSNAAPISGGKICDLAKDVAATARRRALEEAEAALLPADPWLADPEIHPDDEVLAVGVDAIRDILRRLKGDTRG